MFNLNYFIVFYQIKSQKQMDIVFKTNTSSQSLDLRHKKLDEDSLQNKNEERRQKNRIKDQHKQSYQKRRKQQRKVKITNTQSEDFQKKQSSKVNSEKIQKEENQSIVKRPLNKEQRYQLKIRASGLCLLSVIIGIFFAYGFGSQINSGYFTIFEDHSLVGVTFILAAIFTVIGFGLLFSYYIESIFTGIFTALYIVSLTLILSPLLQKFWLNIFIGNFGSITTSTNVNAQVIIKSNESINISINFINLKLALCCAISQLIIYLSVMGKVQLYKTLMTSLVFIIIWNLNYFLCLHVLNISPDTRFFDDYAISMVYVFGSIAALVMTFDSPNNLHKMKSSNRTLKYPKILSFLGIFFLWMSFSLTFSIVGIRKPSAAIDDSFFLRTIVYPEASIGMFFALSSSVISTVAFSIIFNSNIKFSALIGGSISGAIMYGSVASFAVNIAIPITLGIFSGFFSVVYTSKLLAYVNKKHLNDSIGLFGAYSVSAIFGVAMVAPIVIYCYVNYGILPEYMQGTGVALGKIGWVLVFVGISTIGGFLCGMINSTILRCFNGEEQHFGDYLTFVPQLLAEQRQLQEGLTSQFQLQTSVRLSKEEQPQQ